MCATDGVRVQGRDQMFSLPHDCFRLVAVQQDVMQPWCSCQEFYGLHSAEQNHCLP